MQYYQKNKVGLPTRGRRFVIGDIHGCYHTFRALIKHKIKLHKDDQLFLLGDYINKGPDSSETLNFIIQLIKWGYKVYPLRGNHEDELLDASKDEPKLVKWLCRRSSDLLKKGKVRKKHLEFFDTLPYYYELPDFFLVHGGFNFSIKNPLADKNAMLWSRISKKQTNFGGDKRIIHGHQPLSIDIIRSKVYFKSKIIGLDNGVNLVKKNNLFYPGEMGNLCAMDLDTFDLYIQQNIENQQLSIQKLKTIN